MTANRISTIVIVIAVGALAVATASLAAAPKTMQAPDDFALRHPNGLPGKLASITVNYAGSQYALNDPEFGLRAAAVDTSDYFLRHPEWQSASGPDTSDYFLRHPEFIGQ